MTEYEVSPQLQQIFRFIDNNSNDFVNDLAECVAIKSISAQATNRNDIINMVKWMCNRLTAEGVKCELVDIGHQDQSDGTVLPLPPVIMGQIGTDPNKKTLCVYGHLDVQPADKEDGWDTDPFILTEKDGRLYGRGTTDDKGPVLGWLHIIQAFNALKIELPINIKLIFEGMEESGSLGLHELIRARANTFLKDVDYVCISDNYWLGTEKPCLTYGLRGNAHFFVEIQCAVKDLHSGIYGGSVHEAMTDLTLLLSKMVDNKGNILIPGIMDEVSPFTRDEQQIYNQIEFDCRKFCEEVGTSRLKYPDKINVLAHRWRFPSLSIHGIQGAFGGEGAKTVIPHKVIGKFSIRLVPNQDPKKIEKMVLNFLDTEFKSMDSPKKLRVKMISGSRPWLADPNCGNFVAGRNAIKSVFGIEPDLTREGASIPITLLFEEVTRKAVMLLPMGSADDGAHSQNEKINKTNYIEGTKVFASYVYQLAQIE